MNNFGMGFKQRLGLAVLEAGLVVGVLYYLGHRDWIFIGSIAGAIAVSALSPPRISGLVSGVCMIALAVLFYLSFKWKEVPLILGGVGAIFLIYGILKLNMTRPKR